MNQKKIRSKRRRKNEMWKSRKLKKGGGGEKQGGGKGRREDAKKKVGEEGRTTEMGLGVEEEKERVGREERIRQRK